MPISKMKERGLRAGEPLAQAHTAWSEGELNPGPLTPEPGRQAPLSPNPKKRELDQEPDEEEGPGRFKM